MRATHTVGNGSESSTGALSGLLPSVLNSEVTAFLNQTLKVAVENGRISYSALGANESDT